LSTIASPTRQRRKAARPLELVNAALAEFTESGFAATRIDDVATRAGVSKGTLYLYYPSKVALLKAVIEEHLASSIAASEQRLRDYQSGAVAPLIRESLVAWWVALYESPASAVFKIIISEVRNFPELADAYYDRVIEPGQRLIGAALKLGMDRGEFRQVDIAHAVRSLVSPLVMQCLYKHTFEACTCNMPSSDMRQFAADHVDLILAGLSLAAKPHFTPSRQRPTP
jgi:AcrR family transcriptional regulator